MPTAAEHLHNAIAAHNAGRLTEAEVGYSRVLRRQPNEARALYGLGLLSYHSRSRDKGIQYLVRSLQSAPRNGRAWITLGSMYSETGKAPEALAAYRRATQVAPELADGWYNLGICLKREGDFDGAAQQLRRATACPSPSSHAYEALSALYYERGQLQEAAQTVADWALREPGNPTAIHMAAAVSSGPAPPRASDAHVRNLFDAFADGFDRNLQELKYQAPQLVASALRASSSAASAAPPFDTVLDAGCGTGLCGPLVRNLCRTLVGVDLSTKMLAHAQRRNCYDELQTAELGAFMRTRPRAFDAIVCADTLVYFGDLAEPLAAAHAALREAGVFVFTVEAPAEAVEAEHRLEMSGRYSHSEGYLRRILGESGFDIASIARKKLREERAADVEGYLVVADKSSTSVSWRHSTPRVAGLRYHRPNRRKP
ncbi:MAG TPA: tetratricopeptide repeat protein [Steroidobacteraceae bacterium]|nr:tetratricopeptide repeat protein [Steroidobacteraceae bacterium]